MKHVISHGLIEAFVVGLAAGAWYLMRRRTSATTTRPYPDFAGNFAL